MSIITTILQLLAPHECVVCAVEGSLLCADCAQGFRQATSCYRCRRLSLQNALCKDCAGQSPLHEVRSAVAYQGAAKHLVWRLKFGNTPAAAESMAELMRAVMPLPSRPLLVPVPTASSRVRQRGYNQANLLAKNLSRLLMLPRSDCLAKVGQHHQLGANRQQRLVQLGSSLRLKAGAQSRIQNRHIILVDDVITTGATLETAASVLLAAGARTVDAVVFAQA